MAVNTIIAYYCQSAVKDTITLSLQYPKSQDQSTQNSLILSLITLWRVPHRYWLALSIWCTWVPIHWPLELLEAVLHAARNASSEGEEKDEQNEDEEPCLCHALAAAAASLRRKCLIRQDDLSLLWRHERSLDWKAWEWLGSTRRGSSGSPRRSVPLRRVAWLGPPHFDIT
jgi:hypothetical protein